MGLRRLKQEMFSTGNADNRFARYIPPVKLVLGGISVKRRSFIVSLIFLFKVTLFYPVSGLIISKFYHKSRVSSLFGLVVRWFSFWLPDGVLTIIEPGFPIRAHLTMKSSRYCLRWRVSRAVGEPVEVVF